MVFPFFLHSFLRNIALVHGGALNSCGTYLAVALLATVAAVTGDSGIQTPEVPHLSISQKKRKRRNEAWFECKRRFTITWKSKPWWVADSYFRTDKSKAELHVCNGIPFILTIWVKSGKMVIGFGVQFFSAQNVCQNELQCECICHCHLCKSNYMTNT